MLAGAEGHPGVERDNHVGGRWLGVGQLPCWNYEKPAPDALGLEVAPVAQLPVLVRNVDEIELCIDADYGQRIPKPAACVFGLPFVGEEQLYLGLALLDVVI